MAQGQEGSRVLQERLRAMAADELRAAVEELAPHLLSLAAHPFGNYLVSELTTHATAHAAVHSALSGHVCHLMQHAQGSRVVQAALAKLPAPRALELTAELEGRVAEVACSTHGSFSVVVAYESSRRPFIVRELAAAVESLATDQNGSRAVQRVLAEAAVRGEDVAAPVEALLALGAPRLQRLAEDRFGNYVVQLALRHAPPPARARLLRGLQPAFRTLALGKCGSNVAELLVELAGPADLTALRAALGDAEAADAMRAHAYGGYVMSALDGRRAVAAN